MAKGYKAFKAIREKADKIISGVEMGSARVSLEIKEEYDRKRKDKIEITTLLSKHPKKDDIKVYAANIFCKFRDAIYKSVSYEGRVGDIVFLEDIKPTLSALAKRELKVLNPDYKSGITLFDLEKLSKDKIEIYLKEYGNKTFLPSLTITPDDRTGCRIGISFHSTSEELGLVTDRFPLNTINAIELKLNTGETISQVEYLLLFKMYKEEIQYVLKDYFSKLKKFKELKERMVGDVSVGNIAIVDILSKPVTFNIKTEGLREVEYKIRELQNLDSDLTEIKKLNWITKEDWIDKSKLPYIYKYPHNRRDIVRYYKPVIETKFKNINVKPILNKTNYADIDTIFKW